MNPFLSSLRSLVVLVILGGVVSVAHAGSRLPSECRIETRNRKAVERFKVPSSSRRVACYEGMSGERKRGGRHFYPHHCLISTLSRKAQRQRLLAARPWKNRRQRRHRRRQQRKARRYERDLTKYQQRVEQSRQIAECTSGQQEPLPTATPPSPEPTPQQPATPETPSPTPVPAPTAAPEPTVAPAPEPTATAPVGTFSLPDARGTDWSKAGNKKSISCSPTVIDVTSRGIVGDGETDNSSTLNGLLSDIREDTVLYFPKGSYYFTEEVMEFPYRDVTIIVRGAGASQTKFLFDISRGKYTGFFHVRGSFDDQVDVEVPMRKGETSVVVDSTRAFKAGDTVLLDQDNDLSLMRTYRRNRDGSFASSLEDWASRTTGQVFEVVAKSDNTLTFANEAHSDFIWDNQRVTLLKPVATVGFEDFTIRGLRNSKNTFSIYFQRVHGGWVSGVASFDTTKAHVRVSHSRNVTIEGSYFEDAFRHDGGGHGYGVLLQDQATDVLVQNNIFTRLRHSLVIKEGAIGNVVRHNFSFDGKQDGAKVAKDVSIHGHYPAMNLVEGNVVEFIHDTDYWGAAGPGNTFFRNLVTVESIKIEDYSHTQNVIGNELGSTNADVETDDTVKDTLIIGNRGGKQGSGSALALPVSLVNDDPPNYWSGDISWPSLGPGSIGSPSFSLPAMKRLGSGDLTTPAIPNCR